MGPFLAANDQMQPGTHNTLNPECRLTKDNVAGCAQRVWQLHTLHGLPVSFIELSGRYPPLFSSVTPNPPTSHILPTAAEEVQGLDLPRAGRIWTRTPWDQHKILITTPYPELSHWLSETKVETLHFSIGHCFSLFFLLLLV